MGRFFLGSTVVSAVFIVATGASLVFPVFAEDCDLDCGNPNGVCVGTDVAECGGDSCWGSGGDCAALGPGKQWTNAITKGSIPGNDQIALLNVTCYNVIPCTNEGDPWVNYNCASGWPVTGWYCSWGAFADGCNRCIAGMATAVEYHTCTIDDCDEGG